MPWLVGNAVGVALRSSDNTAYRVVGTFVAEEGATAVLAVPEQAQLGTGGQNFESESGASVRYSFVRVAKGCLVENPAWSDVPHLLIAGARDTKQLLRAYYAQKIELPEADTEMFSAQSEGETRAPVGRLPPAAQHRAGCPGLAHGHRVPPAAAAVRRQQHQE